MREAMMREVIAKLEMTMCAGMVQDTLVPMPLPILCTQYNGLGRDLGTELTQMRLGALSNDLAHSRFGGDHRPILFPLLITQAASWCCCSGIVYHLHNKRAPGAKLHLCVSNTTVGWVMATYAPYQDALALYLCIPRTLNLNPKKASSNELLPSDWPPTTTNSGIANDSPKA